MKQRLTPNYDHEKIANPSLGDLIDVFEDYWKGYFLAPAQVLLNTPNGDMASLFLPSPTSRDQVKGQLQLPNSQNVGNRKR